MAKHSRREGDLRGQQELFRAAIDLRGPGSFVRCSGELTASTARILRDAVALALDHASAGGRARTVVVDLSDVNACAAAGIEALLEGSRSAHSRGIPMLLLLSPEIRRVSSTVDTDRTRLLGDGPTSRNAPFHATTSTDREDVPDLY